MSLFTRKITGFRGVALFILLPTLIIAFTSFVTGEDDGLGIGRKAPLMTRKMDAIDGKQYSLLDLKEENGIIVVFSCNTCPFVVGGEKFEGWEKQYNALNEAAQKSNFGFVLVNSNEAKRDGDDSFDEMIKHANASNYSMQYLVDANSDLADAMGAKTTPHVFVFDAKDKLIYKGSIDNSWDSKRTELKTYLYNVMDHASNGLRLEENSTPPRGCSIKRVKL
ncbi:MAG: redoxin family protein [Crocinitomicaceae bacterium]|nr:redoxin family protein [Crocinitomicaceae bacterium]